MYWDEIRRGQTTSSEYQPETRASREQRISEALQGPDVTADVYCDVELVQIGT